jgi:hypothetical protein
LYRGLAALDKGPEGGIVAVSCASAGNCTAGGSYRSVPARQFGPSFYEPFVVSQVRGTWHKAEPVPGITTLNTAHSGVVSVLSCTGPGDCSAGGLYKAKDRPLGIFLVSEVRGRWQRARPAPGTAALNTGGQASIISLSCASPGYCSAGGFYTDRSNNAHGFLMTQVRGAWSKAQPVRGRLNGGLFGMVSSVSCAAPGECSAGGSYRDPTGTGQAYVVNEVNGVWRRAEPVPGIARLDKGKGASIASVSCRSPGNCSAVGAYVRRETAEGTALDTPFVVTEVHGRWGPARLVPGMAALNTGGNASFAMVSCASAGNCSAGGFYSDLRFQQPFVVSHVHGIWGKARRVPGVGAFGAGNYVGGGIVALSCPRAGRCGAIGDFVILRGNMSTGGLFVVSQN